MGNSPDNSEPIGADEFHALMDRIDGDGFETSPIIAVGVSGGADSLALVRLLDNWTRARGEHGGRVIGLSVDHGLRPEAVQEVRQVGKWLQDLGIEHHILTWTGPKPTTGIQSKARDARRELMLNWCREAGVLHLCFAHHADDQAETYMMRLKKGSGPAGLAGMSLIREFPQARIIRPLLSVRKTRLVATLEGLGQDWIEDPSNDMDQFERVRIRKALAKSDFDPLHIASVMSEYGLMRAEVDVVCASILARSVQFHPAGYALINADKFCREGKMLGARALGRLLITIGGQEYGANRDKLNRAYQFLNKNQTKRGITLAGCRIVPSRDGYLICRENRNMPNDVVINPGDSIRDNIYWDHRFNVKASVIRAGGAACILAALGEAGWQQIVQQQPELRENPVPLIACYSLPALYCDHFVVQVPHLGYNKSMTTNSCAKLVDVRFSPGEPVLGANFVPL